MNLKESVGKLFSGNVAYSVIQFGAVVGFTRALGAGGVGSFFVFQTVIGMIGIPGDLGVSRAAEKRLSADEPQGEVMTSAVVVKGLLVLPWILGLVLARPYVEQYVGLEGVLPLVVAGLLTREAKSLSFRLLAGQLQVEKNALLSVLGQIVWAVGGFALIYAGWGASAIIVSFILGDLTCILGALVRLNLTFDWPRVRRARDLINFGRYVFIGSLGGFIYQWMDVAILRLFVPVSLIGAYEIAWRVSMMSMLLTKAIRTSLFPQISHWYSEDRLDKIESAFYKWVQVPLFLAIPAFAGTVIIGEDILEVVFGADVSVAYPVLIIFMLEKILRSVQMVIGPSLYAMDKPQLGYRGSVAAIAVNLTLNLTLIPLFGLIGAAVATTMGAATAAIVAIWYVRTFVSIRVPWPRIWWSVFSSATMAGGVFLIRESLPFGWLRLTFGIAAGVALYFLLLFVNDGIRIEMRSAIRDFREAST